MQSPKSRAYKEKKRTTNVRRKHSNKKFYNSKAWRETRDAYMRHYRAKLYREIPQGKWKQMDLTMHQVSYILSLGYLPCETCLKFYCAEAYDIIEEGAELDHIQPINPDDALDNKLGFHGDPFSFDNLQLLCKKHHAKKSQRESRL